MGSFRLSSWIASQMEIREGKIVRYCRVPFCANAVKGRAKIRCCSKVQKWGDSTISEKRWRHMEPHFDWVLDKLNQKPELKNSQVDMLVDQLRDKVDEEVKQQKVKEGGGEKPRIVNLHWDGKDWEVKFD